MQHLSFAILLGSRRRCRPKRIRVAAVSAGAVTAADVPIIYHVTWLVTLNPWKTVVFLSGAISIRWLNSQGDYCFRETELCDCDYERDRFWRSNNNFPSLLFFHLRFLAEHPFYAEWEINTLEFDAPTVRFEFYFILHKIVHFTFQYVYDAMKIY